MSLSPDSPTIVPLSPWNEGATKTAILDFVRRVTTEGSADFVLLQRGLPHLTTMAPSGARGASTYRDGPPAGLRAKRLNLNYDNQQAERWCRNTSTGELKQ